MWSNPSPKSRTLALADLSDTPDQNGTILPGPDDIRRSSALVGPETPPVPAQYRLLREIQAAVVPFIVPPGKFRRVQKPIPSASGTVIRLRTPRKAHIVPARRRFRAVPPPRSPEIAARRRCAPGISSPPGRNTVLPGKLRGSAYRLAWELIPSSPGRLVVPPGNLHRPPGEGISSPPGKYIVLPGKYYRPLREI